jgi:[acyl-carrier-protein] S-malonyltransferase
MLAFVFPGQGSQRVGMGKDLAEAFPEARAAFDRADEVLGFALSRLCFEGPEDQLRLTANAQPALLTACVAALWVLQAHTGASPAVAAGHSLGEYTALVCAGALRFEDALRVVRRRGELMQQAVPPSEGGMTAVLGLERDAVAELCREAAADQVLEPANDNSPSQVVVAGHATALRRLLPLVQRRGGKAVPLDVSAPFHCGLMRPAAERLRAELRTARFSPPRLPVIGNVRALPYRPDEDIAEMLTRQVVSPVRWTESVRQLKALGVREVLEVGPGGVLTGLVKQAEPDLACGSVEGAADVYRVAVRTAPDRRARFEAQGWVRHGFRLASPDGTRCCFDDGLEWDASQPGACGF